VLGAFTLSAPRKVGPFGWSRVTLDRGYLQTRRTAASHPLSAAGLTDASVQQILLRLGGRLQECIKLVNAPSDLARSAGLSLDVGSEGLEIPLRGGISALWSLLA
jgi:hypothetical protein